MDTLVQIAMAEALGGAFRCIAQSVSQMQEAMWAMNQKMERTNDTVCCMAQRLKAQGRTVCRLDRRMNHLECGSYGLQQQPQPDAFFSCGKDDFAAPGGGFCCAAGGARGGGGGSFCDGPPLPRTTSCTLAAYQVATSPAGTK
ncbi:Protein of unknown function [Gryllus bimaculatus]|nr:Protein of unknown function [Gryllus bimaculatus]